MMGRGNYSTNDKQVQPILDYEDVLNITSFVKDQTLSTKGVRFSQDLERLLSQYLKDSNAYTELKIKFKNLSTKNYYQLQRKNEE